MNVFLKTGDTKSKGLKTVANLEHLTFWTLNSVRGRRSEQRLRIQTWLQKRSIVPTDVLGDFLHLYRTARLPSKQIAWAPVGAHFWNVLNCLSVNVVSTVNSQLHKLLLYKKNTHSNCRMSFGCLCVFEKALSPRHPDRSSEIHLELASD